MKTAGVKIEVNPEVLTEENIQRIASMNGRAIERQLRAMFCEEHGHRWVEDDPPAMPWARRCGYCHYSEAAATDA